MGHEVAAFERHLTSRVSNRKLRLEVFCTATREQADRLELLERQLSDLGLSMRSGFSLSRAKRQLTDLG